MADIDKVNLAGTKAKGKRPYFLADKQTEQTLSITMALAMELAVARERIDTLECLLEEKGVISREEVEHYKPNAEEVARRSLQTQEYLARILRILQQDREALAVNDLSVQEVQDILTRHPE
ncbi:hypothetical protein [Aestuariibacter sp. A3R04]|uniref:hypothetical protein n=1 Tax=Aestuariibacter sp. A3R04 TaxID=2841571 RepID=UPI001C0A55E6|nr:hypothetical protein [Aestuariibacter sp. A3R04]MBU3023546.1 hypothetical protein [Aestuariibacter sp. A3R04]